MIEREFKVNLMENLRDKWERGGESHAPTSPSLSLSPIQNSIITLLYINMVLPLSPFLSPPSTYVNFLIPGPLSLFSEAISPYLPKSRL